MAKSWSSLWKIEKFLWRKGFQIWLKRHLPILLSGQVTLASVSKDWIDVSHLFFLLFTLWQLIFIFIIPTLTLKSIPVGCILNLSNKMKTQIHLIFPGCTISFLKLTCRLLAQGYFYNTKKVKFSTFLRLWKCKTTNIARIIRFSTGRIRNLIM